MGSLFVLIWLAVILGAVIFAGVIIFTIGGTMVQLLIERITDSVSPDKLERQQKRREEEIEFLARKKKEWVEEGKSIEGIEILEKRLKIDQEEEERKRIEREQKKAI